MVPPYSHRVPRVRRYSGYSCADSTSHTWLSHSSACLPMQFCSLCQITFAVRTPQEFLPMVWPLPRSLATTSGISVDFFSSPYLDVSVQAVPPVYLFCSVYGDWTLLQPDCSIRKSVDQSLLTTPHSVSALAPSFIGSQCQGILPAHFVA